ncbi:subtilisin-like serine protease pepD [Annulohypoxylon maeteangense]|uniref:subtilisin-like serine protease pepD n=1 Tax=Annulohypoxylon maeteangense TaxID=1927788 RepID=UPI00200837F3|nr:subtilisin-like serine protease pepD [Annulohypoxylon maeteangense]KAI0889336.1 subtilisin-like serine protease pepD [Annulohypoxylon maeteangense]
MMQHLARLALGIFAIAGPALAAQVDILDLEDGDLVPGKYIVSLKPAVDVEAHLSWVRDIHKRNLDWCVTAGLEKSFSFSGFTAYAGEFDDDTMAKILADTNVLSVEQDRVGRISSLVQQGNAPWGLESISSRTPIADTNTRGHTYSYDSTAGNGTFAYVLDSGVLTNNTQFNGRAIKGYNAWNGTESFDDHFGHGTHVAGTIAAETYGIAKQATVVDVKVVRSVGYSTLSHVIDGINWVVNNVTNTPGRAGKSVINMSLAFSTSTTLNRAVDAASAAGILSVVGAGNDNALASTRSPASASTALTVGAITHNRTRASFSNYGSDVDVFAPGVNVASLWNEEGAERILNGTSMSSPHVAGLALYLKGLEDGLDTPAATIKRIRELSVPDVVGNAGEGSANLLAFNGITVPTY